MRAHQIKRRPQLWPRSAFFQCPGGRSQGARGLTLLEVLIALIVLSVGLMGVAALTLQSLQNVHSSLYTSVASAAALDYEERLWILAAGLLPGECPSNSGKPIIDKFVSDWTAGNDVLGLPEPLVSIHDAKFSGTGPNQQFFTQEIEISWVESRFSGLVAENTEQKRERFRYVTTAPCRRASL